MSEALFVFHGIEKTFAEVEILRKVDLSLYPAKCILLTGKNGSGKTTLLKIIAGLEKPEKAEIEFSGKLRCWKKVMPIIRKEIIYLHQQAFLFSGTVESNVAYGLRFTSLTREQRRESLKKALEWSGLTDLAKHEANTLTGGVQQRVAFT
ncbi:MAG: energy-coupling factor ABC transporter ATP-binding protein [Proteobacteria bacterium]|nr:energy-coupling factor ABC transporter ATP-binding protein [Pseudomonadota bacterium]